MGLLQRFSWSWCGTLRLMTFRLSNPRIKILFNAWISLLRNEEGGRHFRWISVFEQGAIGTYSQIHFLVGGLRNRMKSWEARWVELGGEATICRFDPKQNLILDILKTTGSDKHLDIDIVVPKFGPDGDQRDESYRAEPATVLRVEGINEQTSLQDLRRFCEDSARILGITLHSVEGIVYGLVAVARAEADQAVEELDQKLWRGKKIRVSVVGR
jgi:hypothetical protein